MEAVPADIIEEILVRLPVKSLMRFKCVCKGWCALIQSRRVIHRHYCHKSNQDRLVCGMGEYVEDRLEEDRVLLPYFGEDVYLRMIAAMGILCEVSVRGDIVLLNPATHKVKRVPKVPISTKGLLSIGFGLDPGSGDYKIVVCEGGGEFFWVYNASRDCWKRVEVVGCCSVMKKSKCVRNLENCTFSNGVYYWMMVKCGEDGRELEAVIIGFDMATEKFGEIKIPDVIGNPKVVAYGDSIGLLVGLDVWVLGKQGIWSKSWTIINSMLPVCIWKDEVAVVLNCGEWCLIKLEDISRGIGKVVRLGEINPISWKFFIPFCYKESLVWFKGEERLVLVQDV